MTDHVRWSEVPRRYLREERRGSGEICAHCGRPQAGRGAVSVKDASGALWERPLCHPDWGLDCYRLVTVYHHPMPCGCRGSSDHPDQDVCDDCGYRRFEHLVDVPEERRYDFLGRPVPCFGFQPKGRPPDVPRAPFCGAFTPDPPPWAACGCLSSCECCCTCQWEMRPQDPGDGRVWVWLGGHLTPHWELRGTGLIV